jgi:uncharacterized protein (DUF1778 family)
MVTKEVLVNLRATKRQHAAWKLAAEGDGVSLSEFLRRAAERRLVELSSRDADYSHPPTGHGQRG